MTDGVFDRGMALMVATWPDRKPTSDTFVVYRKVLDKLDDSVFERAVLACLERCKFFPVPAEIMEKARGILNDSGALPPLGEEAWAQVVAAIGTYSPDNGWRVPVPGHDGLWLAGGPCPFPPLVEQAVNAIGGMKRIVESERKELGFIRQEFLVFYGHKREQEIRYGITTPVVQALPEPQPVGAAT